MHIIIYILGRYKYKPREKTIVVPSLKMPNSLVRNVMDPLHQIDSSSPISN